MGFNVVDGVLTATDGGFAVAQINGQTMHGISDDLRIHDPVIAVVNPQSISLSREKDIPKPSWRHCKCNVFEGSITGMRKLGSLTQVSIDAGFSLNAEISSDVLDELDVTVGSRVFAQFKAAEVSFLRAQDTL